MGRDRSNRAGEVTDFPSAERLSGAPGFAAASGWRRWWPFLLAAALLAAGGAALAVDVPLARWCHTGGCPDEIENLFHVCEPFGNGVGVLVIALVIHQLDPARRWRLPRVLACSWGAGLAANAAKLLIARVRPRSFDFDGDVWSTFDGWFPWTSAGSNGQSFPSAHTATAVGLALALSWLYPAGWKLFLALAVLVACHRIEAEAHYLSDVLCGAALGVVVATACLKTGRLSRWFDGLEARGGSTAKRA